MKTPFYTALIVVLSLLGCSQGEPERPPGRVLLIGIDGASPRVVEPMMAEGRLPALASLAKDGVYGPLRSVLPLYSPRIWNTIATGRKPNDHGVISFVKPDPDNKNKKNPKRDRELYLSTDRKTPALWNIIAEAGMSVAVVNWWTTYPPEKINGVMVSDHFFPEQIAGIKNTFNDNRASSGALIHPVSWTPTAQEVLEEQEALTTIPNPFSHNPDLPHWVNKDLLEGQYKSDQQITRLALEIQKEFRPDVMMVFMPGIDRASHWLWGNLEPASAYPKSLRPSTEERQAGRAALEEYYEFTDQLIGLLAQDYGPDDLILVISDHGFQAHVSMMLLTGGHEDHRALDGILFARGEGIDQGEPAGPVSVFNLAPSVLAWLGLPFANDMVMGPAPFVGVSQPTRIASYDDMVIEHLETGASGNEEEIVEHLRALGYLEDSEPAAATEQ
ncbi:MAG: alkaline phosphatase family protein [Myxococcota bacterium]|nr:alkaline phosphatase family protein [Myxococcota bacterium]